MLALTGKKVKFAVSLVVLGIALFAVLPTDISGRIDQLSDSSTERREYYLQSGLHSWEARWLTGWGWGTSFWYTPSTGLVPTATGVSWYHNDYLNLAVQTGVIGVGLYLCYWVQALRASRRWLQAHSDSPVAGYLLASQLALVVLLVAACFEHVLWKSDIAGLLGWVSGIMLACMSIEKEHTARLAAP
jgi:O-antigen ligase